MPTKINNQLINADFYLSNSDSEGMSNSLLESMALGVPAIVSNVSGVDEIVIDNQNGFIFEPKNENELYEKLIKAITCSEDDYIKMSHSASKHILDKFSMEIIGNEYCKLYKTLVYKD